MAEFEGAPSNKLLSLMRHHSLLLSIEPILGGALYLWGSNAEINGSSIENNVAKILDGGWF